MLGGAALLFQKGGQKKALTSDVLAPIVVTPAACYLQPDLDKKIAEKKTLEEVQQKSAPEIQTALAAIDATILTEGPLVTQKKELDVLSAQKMTTEKPSKMAYMQAEKKVNSMVKPVVPTEPTLVAEPVVPAKPTLAPAPVVPRKPVEPKAPVAPAVPKVGTAAYKTYINVTKPRYDAAKKVYDEQTKPAYDAAKKVYDDAVSAKKVYDTVTKPAYTKALAEYNTAVAAKRKYDTVTKPAYDKAKKVYDDAVAAKKVYDDAVSEYNNLLEQYNNQLAEYNAYVAFKSSLDAYTIAVISSLNKNIETIQKGLCPATESLCSDKIDDDRDGIQDCDDSDCSQDNACKKDVVTCTVGSGDKLFRFEHSNGSTDFTGQTFSMGSADPYIMSYQVEYSRDITTLTTDIYLDGEKLDCPPIMRNNNSSDGTVPTCKELQEELEGEDAAAIQCTGEYSFIVRYESDERPRKPSLFSSFLRSNIFYETEQNDNTNDNTCDTVNCYECGSNQTKDSNGNCVDVGCPYGQEEVNGSCVDSCLSPQVRNASGTCEDPGCSDGEEMVNGSCTPVCVPPQVRNSAGVCETPGCTDGQEEWNGTCVDPCVAPQTRQSDGTCSSGGYCGNGTVDEGEECDGGSDCDSSCKKTGYCGNSTVDSGEECDDGNTTNDDGCSASCTNESGSCGDGTVDEDEECDDGNTSNDDGCDASCKNECTDENS